MKINTVLFRIFRRKNNLTKGYIALLSVVVLGIVGTSIMLSVILSGIGSLKTNIVLEQSSQAKSVSTSCGEEALQKILETGTTSSIGSLAIASGTCSYSITNTGGAAITIQATGVVSSVTSKIRVIIATTTPSIVLSSWEEVADF